MKGMRNSPPGFLLSVWIKLQFVEQITSHKMLQKKMGMGRGLLQPARRTIEK